MKKATRKYSLILIASVLLTIGVTALLANIFHRKVEAKNPFYRVVELNDDTDDPAIWGKNFPLQYDGYTRTVDMVRTRFGGSEALPRVPDDADPRSIVAQSRLEEDPRLKTMWSGYAFATDFREERGHAYMLTDQLYTERQKVAQQPGACVNCHASVYTTYKKLGNNDIVAGFETLNALPYDEALEHVKHPVACIDCHDPGTMKIRVTRVAFMKGMSALKAKQGIKDYDVNRDATHQEMRSFVCGQCHVEYYFKGGGKELTYPWTNGLKIEQIYQYYEQNPHDDWTHKETGARVLKAQHPEFEMWNQGIHARSGVACADCHMPYTRVGALKISDHHVRSPLLNIHRACQTCHRMPEEEIKTRAEEIQTRVFSMRDQALDALMDLIGDLKKVPESARDKPNVKNAQQFQRRAQFYLDFVEAENSTGFHAPQEALRILGESINYARQGQLELRR
jgi:nitrite reductase (cytochrome c-552)